MKSDPFRDHVLQQLAELGRELRSRAMFGGHGLYFGETIFGIVWKGQLFFKTSAESSQRYIARGMAAFQPSPGTKLGRYYEVPEDVIERRAEILVWAREAIDVAAAPSQTTSRQKNVHAKAQRRKGKPGKK